MKRDVIIEEVFANIEKASTMFYQRKNKEGYDAVNTCIPQILTCLQMIQQNEQADELEKSISLMNEGLTITLQAIQSKDTILIADQLVHVIKPLLKQMIA